MKAVNVHVAIFHRVREVRVNCIICMYVYTYNYVTRAHLNIIFIVFNYYLFSDEV